MPPEAEQPFDPTEQKKQKGILDNMVEAAETLRGTLGGAFGKVVGVALDITSRIRDLRAKAEAAKAEVPPTAQIVPTPTAQIAPAGASGAGAAPTAIPVGAPAAVPVGGGMSMAAVAGAVATIAAVAVAMKVAVNAVMRATDRYSEYSPQIAREQAMAEIRMTLGDLRRARDSGKDLAEAVRAQSIMQNKWEDAKMALMKKLIPVVTGLLEVLGTLLGIASRRNVEDEEKNPTSILLDNLMEVPTL